MLDRQTFTGRLQTYFLSWEDGDPRLITSTFSPDGE